MCATVRADSCDGCGLWCAPILCGLIWSMREGEGSGLATLSPPYQVGRFRQIGSLRSSGAFGVRGSFVGMACGLLFSNWPWTLRVRCGVGKKLGRMRIATSKECGLVLRRVPWRVDSGCSERRGRRYQVRSGSGAPADICVLRRMDKLCLAVPGVLSRFFQPVCA